MSIEFDEWNKLRENPTEEMNSKFLFVLIFLYFTYITSIISIFLDMVEFTDEEGYGKYLDLHECHEKYINLKGVEVSHLPVFFFLLNVIYS